MSTWVSNLDDLSYYEEVVDKPEERRILHFYSDSLKRAILRQRRRVPRPRDYYDLWWVLKERGNSISRSTFKVTRKWRIPGCADLR